MVLEDTWKEGRGEVMSEVDLAENIKGAVALSSWMHAPTVISQVSRHQVTQQLSAKIINLAGSSDN